MLQSDFSDRIICHRLVSISHQINVYSPQSMIWRFHHRQRNALKFGDHDPDHSLSLKSMIDVLCTHSVTDRFRADCFRSSCGSERDDRRRHADSHWSDWNSFGLIIPRPLIPFVCGHAFGPIFGSDSNLIH